MALEGREVVIVEAGITLGELQAALRQNGQRLAIDAPNSVEMTIGGMLAASSIGIFLVPMLYVTFQRWREAALRPQ